MAKKDAYAVWEEKTLQRGAQRGVERGLPLVRTAVLRMFEVRFGPVPAAVRARVEGTKDLDQMAQWLDLVSNASHAEVIRALADA